MTTTQLRGVRVVLTDIDGTLTDAAGRLPARAYAAMESLRDAGLTVVPVTGRPAGWCDLIARLWPVAAVVGENGAFHFRYNVSSHRMERRYLIDDAARRNNRVRLDRLAEEILKEVQGARIAADQPFREADLAIDFAEDVVPSLNASAVARIVAIFERHGATAKVSNIHVNGWFGSYDKLRMSRLLLAETFGISDDEQELVLYIGDSPNDEPMFAAFTKSVAVANYAAFADRVTHQPTWITTAAGGDGFAELADRLLKAQG